jgi:signal transduction histidine kinase
MIKFGYMAGQEGRTREALAYNLEALHAFRNAGRIMGEAVSYNNIGNDYESLGMADSAIHYFLEGIKKLENRNDGSGVLAALYENVGNTYAHRLELPKAIFYAKKALAVAVVARDTARIITANTALSNAYVQDSSYQLALATAQQAHHLLKPDADPVLQAKVYLNLAAAYVYLQQPEAAITAARKSMQASEDWDLHNYVAAGLYLSDAYGQKKAYSQQKSILEDLRQKSEAQPDAILNLHEVYGRLAAVSFSLGDLKNAYQYQVTYGQLKEAVFTRQSQEAMLETETRYQTARKEKALFEKQSQLSEKKLALEKSNRYSFFAGSGFLLALLLATGIYLQLQSKKKTFAVRLLTLQKQKEIEMLHALMQGEEKERTRIAKDLHDGVAGMLAAAKMHFSSLPLPAPLLQADGYQQGMHLVNEATGEIRKISHNLMPEVLLVHGLDQALRRYCNNISGTRLVVEYDSWGEIKRYASSFELSVYRIVQELLNNILKHAGASRALVQMSLQNETLFITVEDNGTGFPANKPTDGMGLEHLRSRVKAMNGSIEVESTTGSGVSAYLEFCVAGLEETTVSEQAACV